MITKVNKIMINGLLLSLVISCNVVISPTTNTYQVSSEKQLGKLLNFESRIKYEGLEKDKEQNKEGLKLNLDVLNSGTDKIKIPVYGEFKLIFESSNVYRISDNDASDGEARVQLPSEVFDIYINTKYPDNELNTSLKIEDNLYYLRDDLTKDKTYRLGKRQLPIPDSWHSKEKNSYVLKLKNNGISKADIKFYKSENVDYPSGIKEIGEEGGIIELRGVAKLEIPKGAISKKTVIVINQELQGREPLDLGSSHSNIRMPSSDYVSPLVKIEPMGLKLKKDAILSFDYVDLKRLGNNHPRVLHYMLSLDQDHWYGIPMYSELPVKEWTPYLPAKIDELGYYSKFILKWNQPTSNIQAELDNSILQERFTTKEYEDEEKNFDIQATSPKMEFDIQNVTDKKKVAELKSRASLTYKMFSSLGYKLIKCDVDKNGYIVSIFDKNFLPKDAIAATYKYENRDKTICSRIAISKDYFPNKTGLEHELWHSFQFSNLNIEYMDSENIRWLREATADYMGSKAYERSKSNLKLKNDEKQIYIDTLNTGIDELGNTIVDRNSLYKGYDAWGLFNTISRLEKEDKDKSAMKAFEDIYGSPGSTKINSGSKYLKHYHDYAVDSFISTQKNYEKKLGKLFVYNPTQQIPTSESIVSSDNVIRSQFIQNNLKGENPIKSVKGELNNFSSKYFKIKAGDINQTELKFKVKNISRGVNITPILFSKEKNEFVYVPRKRVLNTKTKRYDYTGEYEIYTDDFDLSDASEDKLSFGKNTGSVVLALSYADPSIELTNKGAFELEIGYNCPKLDDKESNKNVGILQNSTCYKEKGK